MKLKTFLLGSAAAFAVVGGAQAADLSVAEPVENVRVCDAFGVGYWYIPGTDTCLKIGGYVQFDVNFHSNTGVYSKGPFENLFGFHSNDHSATWDFVTEAGLNFTAKSMTEYGILTGYIALLGKSDNSIYDGGGGKSGFKIIKLDSAYLELGPLLAGYTSSLFDYGGEYTFGGGIRSDVKVDQVKLSWAMSGFGLAIGIEDPRDRWGTALATNYSMPDIIAAITASQGHWDGKLSVGFTQGGGSPTGTGLQGWGVLAGITVKLDALAPGDALRVQGAWSNNAASFVCGSCTTGGLTTGSSWSALASFQHFWSTALSTAVTVAYLSDNGTGTANWNANVNLAWAPVKGFLAGAEFGFHSQGMGVGNAATSSYTGKIRLKRSW